MKIISRWRWVARKIAKELWPSTVLYSCAAVFSVLAGLVFQSFIPDELASYLDPGALDRILGILASSMLAVTTFSLATMVSAHASVIGNTSPRASTLLINNDVTRNALGAFIGSFLFSLIAIIALSAGLYEGKGHVVLFTFTLAVVVLIVVALLRWIDHLIKLSRVSETADKVENATMDALLEYARNPYLGAQPLEDIKAAEIKKSHPVYSSRIGYVQHVDMSLLFSCVKEGDGKIFIVARPGSFASSEKPLVRVLGIEDEQRLEKIKKAFSIGDARTFDFDPRFGFSVMGEIASRALSPGINDPGTAIDIIGRAVRVLSKWYEEDRSRVLAQKEDKEKESHQEAHKEEDSPPNVWVMGLDVSDFFDDVFTPIARDGAGVLSVQIRLQKAFAALAGLGDDKIRDSACHHSAMALKRADVDLKIEADKERLKTIVEQADAL